MRLHTLLLLALAAWTLAAPSFAQGDAARPGRSKLNLDKKSLAIDGYDPVAYFPEGGSKPAKGKKDITAQHRGVTYRFRDTKNRDRFLLQPDKYEPAFGGWCAWAMADDDRVSIDPDSFLIQDGELLLFYDGFLADTRKKWRKGDTAKLKREAGGHWRQHFGVADRDLTKLHLEKGLALGGHDPVAYRGPKGTATPGDAKLTYTYRGATYRFATQANLDTFRRDPARYEARLGGFDPMALVEGARVGGSPTVFAVVDDALYVFASDEARTTFLEDSKTHAAKARAAHRRG